MQNSVVISVFSCVNPRKIHLKQKTYVTTVVQMAVPVLLQQRKQCPSFEVRTVVWQTHFELVQRQEKPSLRPRKATNLLVLHPSFSLSFCSWSSPPFWFLMVVDCCSGRLYSDQIYGCIDHTKDQRRGRYYDCCQNVTTVDQLSVCLLLRQRKWAGGWCPLPFPCQVHICWLHGTVMSCDLLILWFRVSEVPSLSPMTSEVYRGNRSPLLNEKRNSAPGVLPFFASAQNILSLFCVTRASHWGSYKVLFTHISSEVHWHITWLQT